MKKNCCKTHVFFKLYYVGAMSYSICCRKQEHFFYLFFIIIIFCVCVYKSNSHGYNSMNTSLYYICMNRFFIIKKPKSDSLIRFSLYNKQIQCAKQLQGRYNRYYNWRQFREWCVSFHSCHTQSEKCHEWGIFHSILVLNFLVAFFLYERLFRILHCL